MIVFLLIIAAVLVTIGTVGMILKRNPLLILMCALLIINGGSLALIVADRLHGSLEGQLLVLILMVAAFLLLVTGLALIQRVFGVETGADVDEYSSLHG